MIVVTLVGVFISGFLFGAVLGFRRLEDWFDPWVPDAVTERLVGTGPEWSSGFRAYTTDDCDYDTTTGDVLPESTTETLR